MAHIGQKLRFSGIGRFSLILGLDQLRKRPAKVAVIDVELIKQGVKAAAELAKFIVARFRHATLEVTARGDILHDMAKPDNGLDRAARDPARQEQCPARRDKE